MQAVKTILAGGAAMAALVSAAPVSAQYYPGNPYAYGTTPYGYNGYGNVGVNSQVAVSQCTNAVQARLNRDSGYGYNGYGNGGYAYNGYGDPYGNDRYGYGNAGGGRVLGISRIEPRSNGGLTIRGVANSGRTGAYGYNGGQPPVDLTFKCKTDYRGYVTQVDINAASRSDYGYNRYTPNNNDYSQYGYSRY